MNRRTLAAFAIAISSWAWCLAVVISEATAQTFVTGGAEFATRAEAELAAAADPACQWESSGTPARVAPAERDIRPGEQVLPTGTSSSAHSRDTTWFNQAQGWTFARPLWQWVVAGGGHLYAATNLGMQVWKLGASGKPGPRLVYQAVEGPLPGNHDFRRVLAMDLSGSVLCVGGIGGVGMRCFDVSQPNNPTVILDDPATESGGKEATWGGVAVTQWDGESWGFLAARGTGDTGLWWYDLTARRLVQRLTTDPMRYVDTVDMRVFSAGGGLGAESGVKGWDLRDGSLVFDGFAGETIAGLATWSQSFGGSLYLATTRSNPKPAEVRIHRLQCPTVGQCAAERVWGLALPAHPLAMPLQVSHAGGRVYLYLGRSGFTHRLAASGLWDVTDAQRAHRVGTGAYWSSYYSCNPRGDNFHYPRSGVVVSHNGKVNAYTASDSTLGWHVLGEGPVDPPPPPPPAPTDTDGDGIPDDLDECPKVAGPPPSGCPAEEPAPPEPPAVVVARFIWSPARPTTGEAVTLNASGSTAPSGSLYSWSFAGGTTTGIRPTITFSQPGDQVVRLGVYPPGCQFSNCAGQAEHAIPVSGEPSLPPEPPEEPVPPIVITYPGAVTFRPGLDSTGRCVLELIPSEAP